MKKYLVLLAVLLSIHSGGVFAESIPVQVTSIPGGIPISRMVELNGVLFFIGYTNEFGTELYRLSDDGNAIRHTDLNENGGSFPERSWERFLFPFQGDLYFSASDSSNNFELWKTDGETFATSMVADINPLGSSNPVWPVVVGETMFFRAETREHGQELWKTDGTTAGTQMVMDINPGSGNGGVNNTVVLGDVLIFGAQDGVNGHELWRTDGSAAGTYMIKDIYPGPFSSNTDEKALLNGRLYFAADDSVHGLELWTTDGTEAGTHLVADINPGPDSSVLNQVTSLAGALYMVAAQPDVGGEPWRSDGTAEGTILLADINPNGWSDPDDFSELDGIVYFGATDDAHGYELWRTDGTPEGTWMVADVNPGSDSSFAAHDQGKVFEGELYFPAYDSVDGDELWKTDGTQEGTVRVTDVAPGADSVVVNIHRYQDTTIEGEMFFSASNGVDADQVWKLPSSVPDPYTGPLVSAVLPSSRSLQTGATGTVFLTAINAGDHTAHGCGIALATPVTSALDYQSADETNQPTGSLNGRVSIAAGASQRFVVALRPFAAFGPMDVQLSVDCSNTDPAAPDIGVNSLLVSAHSTPTPDVIALAATVEPGLTLTAAPSGAFSVATVNLGSTGAITVRADDGGANLPLTITACETNPATGQCTNPVTPSSDPVTLTIAQDATPTFAFFVTATDNFAFDPSAHRIFVRFDDENGKTRGATSVAVQNP